MYRDHRWSWLQAVVPDAGREEIQQPTQRTGKAARAARPADARPPDAAQNFRTPPHDSLQCKFLTTTDKQTRNRQTNASRTDITG